VSFQENPHGLFFPSVEFILWKGLEELRPDFELPLQKARLTVAVWFPKWHQSHHRLVALSDDDNFPFARLFNEAREVGLGAMDGDCFY
jgi:hypothetical protein